MQPMLKAKRIFMLLVGLPIFFFPQARVIDSLFGVLRTAGQDTNRVNTCFLLSDKLWRLGVLDTAMLLATDGQALAEKLDYKKGLANCLTTIGIVHWQHGNYPQGLTIHFRALKIREAINDRKGIAISYNNIGNIYWNQQDFDKAIEYHKKALEIRKEINDIIGMAASYNNIGIIHIEKVNYPEALKCFLKSVELREQQGDRLGMAIAFNNIGIVHEHDTNYAEAYNYYKRSLEIREILGDKTGLANSFSSIGNLFIAQKKYAEARKYINKAQGLSLQLANKRHLLTGYQRLARLDSIEGNFKSAYENYKMSVIYRDSLDNEANTKKSVRAAMNYEFEKKEAATRLEQEKKDVIAHAESRRQKLITWTISAFGVLILVFAIFAYRSFLQKRRANKELAEKNRAVAEQKKLVEHKNILITDSIEYAKSIQEAILPAKETLDTYLGKEQHFTFFKPKDLVSGDFYWAKPVKDKIYVAAIDCTGHGVPGAFMSLMAFNMLENIIIKKEFSQPALVLDELNLQVLSILRQQTENASAKYGMDIALVEIDRKKNKVEYAGAHNPLLIVRGGGSAGIVSKEKPSPLQGGVSPVAAGSQDLALSPEVAEIRANKTTIGMAREKFTNHTLPIQQGDMLYIFTDGFPDQKGGPENKKFFSSVFKELLVSISPKICSEQKLELERTFGEWKKDGEQTDDVLVMGIRI